MKTALVALPFVLLVAGATAPAQVVLELHDGGTDFASRGSIPAASRGWVVNRYPRGAHGGGIGSIVGLRAVLQDADCGTPNTAELAVFGESPSVPGTPDETSVLATTGPFTLPFGGGGPCAWLFTVTFTPAVAHCPATQDVFAATFLDASIAWPGDGLAVHISLENPSVGAAAQYPPATPGQGPGAEYGADFVAGSGGGASTTYPLPWRIHHSFLIVDQPAHATRAGVAAGFFPDFGMAGRFPDATNQAGTNPPRLDDPVWLGDAPAFPTGIGFLCLSPVHSGPVPLPGIGCLELATTNVALPAVPLSGARMTYPLSLTALGVRALMTGGISVWAQEIRFDPATGRVSIGSLAVSTYF